MVLENEEIVKQGTYYVKFSSAKKYQNTKGNLVLTKKSLFFIVNGQIVRKLYNKHIGLSVDEECLEVYSDYNKLLFKLVVDKPEKWNKIIHDLKWEKLDRKILGYIEEKEKSQRELQGQILELREELPLRCRG